MTTPHQDIHRHAREILEIHNLAKTQKLMESISKYHDLHKQLGELANVGKTVSDMLGPGISEILSASQQARIAADVLKPFHDHQKLMDQAIKRIGVVAQVPDMSGVFDALNAAKQLEAIGNITFPQTRIAEALKAYQIELPSIAPVEGLLAKELFAKDNTEVTLEAVILDVGDKSEEGQLVLAVGIPWLEIYNELERNPEFLFQFTKHPRKFEEFIAGAYERAGFDKVTLTPSSGDKGRDVIAEKTGYGAIRILDQAKAYSPGHCVPANDVRALFGVVAKDPAASKGIVTTTSTFAPGVYDEFAEEMPTRLELRAGADLLEYLGQIVHATN